MDGSRRSSSIHPIETAPISTISGNPGSSGSKDNKKKRISFLIALRKFVVIFAIFLLTLILLIQTFQCLRKYFSNPTYIATDVVPQSEAEFPAITICPEGNSYKDEVLWVSQDSYDWQNRYKSDVFGRIIIDISFQLKCLHCLLETRNQRLERIQKWTLTNGEMEKQ